MSPSWMRGFLLSPVLALLFAANLYAQSSFVYTNNDVSGPNTVSGFAVTGNGVLSPVPGSPFFTGGTGAAGGFFSANRATICSGTKFIYVANSGSNDVSGFSVDPATGSLALVSPKPFPTGSVGIAGIALACTPDGRFLAAASSDSGDITMFRIGGDGALTPIAGSPFSAGSSTDGIRISPDGNFLAAALVLINKVAMFKIQPDGTLTPVAGSPFAGASVGAVAGVDISCSGKLLFGGSNSLTTTVNVFDIAPSGVLAALPDSPFTPGVGANSNVVLLNANDRLLFASNQNSSSVTVFTVAPNGSLSLVGSPFPAPGSPFPSGMATDQAGKFLYVADGGNAIHGYGVADDGVLTALSGSPFPTNQSGGVLLSLTAFPGKICNRPPDCSQAAATPSTAWPPNQQMVSIGISGVSDPDGDPVTVTPTKVFQNEPVTPGGDATLDPLTVRADRDGVGDGRVYTIQFTASDGRGGSCAGAVTVCVPHDQGTGVSCSGTGPLLDSVH